MTIRTLVVGYEPSTDHAALKPSERRNYEYFDGVLGELDLGEVHFAKHDTFREKINELDPVIVIAFDGSTAEAVRTHRRDVILYVVDSLSAVFYRKAEVAQRQEKHRKIFGEIAKLIERLQQGGQEEVEGAQRYAAMTFDDKYKMIIQAIISDREDLRQKAWELINRNDVDPDFLWIRAKLIIDLWQRADAKGRQEFLEAAMRGHIDSGAVRQIDDFTDEDGQVYLQYMRLDADGGDTGRIDRVPVAKPGQGKYDYENLFHKHDTANPHLSPAEKPSN